MNEQQNTRLDLWIWAVRLVRTRALANSFCKGKKVKVNDQVAKPSRKLQIDDLVTLSINNRIRVLKVVGFSNKRLSAKEAAKLIEDLSPPVDSSKKEYQVLPPRRAKGAGRPTKKERRILDKFRGEQ